MTLEKGNVKKQGRVPEDFPCKKEKLQSLECLAANSNDQSRCKPVFENFRFCMQFWDTIKKMRREKQIKPILPPPEERNDIQRTYLATGKYPDYSEYIS